MITRLFFGYQQTQIRNIQNGLNALVPTTAELNGDFSAIPTQLFNPVTKAPYAGNQIPKSTFDPAAVLFATKYLPATTNGQVTYGLPLSQSFHEYITRGDRVIGSKDRVFGRYYLDKYNNNPLLNPGNYLATVSLNHTNLNNPTTAANSANFGNIQSAQDPRIGQLALKLLF